MLSLSVEIGRSCAPVREVDASDPAVRVDLHACGLDVIRAVGPSREVCQVELNLIPTARQADRHRRAEGLDPSGALEIAHSEPPVHALVVEYLPGRKRYTFLFVSPRAAPSMFASSLLSS